VSKKGLGGPAELPVCDGCKRRARCERKTDNGVVFNVCVDWRDCMKHQPPREVLLAK
jgi:hypothetical protein